MTLAASGSLSRALVGLDELVADSTAFRGRVGAATRAEAQQRIHYGDLEILPGLNQRPFAVLVHDSHGALQIGQDDHVELGARGGIVLALCDNAQYAGNDKDSYLDFANFVGDVTDEIGDLTGKDYNAGASIYWSFRSMETLVNPRRVPRDQRAARGDYWIWVGVFRHNVDEGAE